MLDITTAGSSVEVEGVCTITRFSDDSDPWTVEEVEVTGYGVTINGELLVWAKPCAYIVSVNVLSGTPEAKALGKLIRKSRVKPTQGGAGEFDSAAAKVNGLSIHLQAGELKNTTYKFTTGRVLKGPMAPSANNDGRTTSQNFTFVFEDMGVS